MLQLLAEIASCGSCPTIYFPQFPVDGFLPGIMAERARQKVIMDYMLHAQLPVVRPARQASSSRRSDLTRLSSSASPEQHSRLWSTANTIAKSVESELELLQGSEDLPKEFSAQRLRQTIGLAVVALLFDALLVHNGLESDDKLQTSLSDLLTRILPKIFLHQWSTAEQQFLIQGFLPLVTDRIPNSDIDWQAMIQPTEKTGIRYTLLQKFRIHDVGQNLRTKELLCTLWRMPKVNVWNESIAFILKND
jgi:ataxia telangiectasia mutated family protein